MAEFNIQKGIDLYNQKKYADALVFFLSLDEPENYDNSLQVSYYLGLCQMKMLQYEQAIESLEPVVTANKVPAQVAQCRLLLSVAYAKTGRLTLAEKELALLQSSDTNLADSNELFNVQAFLCFERGDAQQAIDCYERVLIADPNNVTALNSLGYILADTGTDLPRALSLCRQAADACPDYAPYLDSLAWVYHKMHYPNEAKQCIEKAIQLLPENQTIKKHYDVIFEK